MSLSDKDITAKNFQEFYNRIKPFLNQTAPSGFTPIGTVISVMGKKAPENYLACDGTAYNILAYPELAVYIKDQFGSYNYFGGDGTTTFAVPDLRGEFLRGTGTNSHTNQGSGANVGVHQDATEHRSFNSGPKDWGNIFFQNASATVPGSINKDSDINYLDTSSKGAHINKTQDTRDYDFTHYTSRPTNTSVLYCIAYKNIFIDVKQAYSLNERVVGTWIDGKPLYQKTATYTITSTVSATKILMPIVLTNLNRAVKVEGTLDNISLPIGTYSSSAGVISFGAVTSSSVELRVGGTQVIASGTVLFTVQYTKTTD